MKEKTFICILALCCLLGGCGAAHKAPTGNPPFREGRQLTVWSAYWDCQESVTVIDRCTDRISAVSLFAAYFRDGTLFLPEETQETLRALRRSDAGDPKPIYLSVVNDVTEGEKTIQKDTEILRSVLSPHQAEGHARELVALAKEYGFDGIEIDYEKLREDPDLWEQFLSFEEILLSLAQEAGLKYITPFGYAEGADILTDGRLNPSYLAVGAAFTAIGILAAFWEYGRKDIH